MSDSDHVEYPPYGHMVQEWEKLTVEPRTKPPAWHGGTEYEDWRTEIVSLLSDVLWPRYQADAQAWDGHARAFMHALTCADFRLFRRLRPRIWEAVDLLAEKVDHYTLFVLEDEADAVDKDGVVKLDRSLDASLRRYLAGKADRRQIDDIAGGYLAGLGAKSGNVDLDIKIDMQRPRAFQMAWLLGERWFTHQHAKSAVTPSMISGHCVEAMMGGVAAYARARELGCSQAALDAIAQHTVDAGDRRVLAGVHYPSDNISSWLTGLLLCPHVCVHDDGAQWLWKAISERSLIYREIDASMVEGASPYALAMSLLTAIGERKVESAPAAHELAKKNFVREAAE